MTNSENRCKARECDKCCWNTFLGMSFDNFDVFKRALEDKGVDVRPQSNESFKLIQGFRTTSRGNTVVCCSTEHDESADVLVQIIRKCPFLVDGDCELIDDSARPAGCNGIVFDGTACQRIRSGGFTFIPSVTIE